MKNFSNAIRSRNKQLILSTKWKNWKTELDLKTCELCVKMHGKIYPMDMEPVLKPPLHLFCRCQIKAMEAIVAGYATTDGTAGADYWLQEYKKLPPNYIDKTELLETGWSRGKSPADYAAGKMVTMGCYNNFDGHLPAASGRIWHEADINYHGGKRNSQRILWSNDGLIFVTYDHYKTFVEII